MGDRTIEASGSIVFEDLTNNVKAVVIFSTYTKTGFWTKTESGKRDEYRGIIYECEPIQNPEATAKLLYSKTAHEFSDLSKVKDIVKPICNIEGSWLKNLVIGEREYWNIDKDIPFRQIPSQHKIAPSDWRFREDLLWLKYDCMRIASQWKFRQEEQQRHDRKIRLKRKEERLRSAA